MDSQSKNWVFTLNNPTMDFTDLTLLKGYTYCVVAKEISSTGTPHYQGFVQMPSRQRLSGMKKLIPGAHWEPMMGSSEQARDYCFKDGDYIECGKFISVLRLGGAAGGNKKAERYRSAIKLAKSRSFTEMEEEHPDMYWNSYHTMKRIAMDHPAIPQELDQLDNQWIYGAPGVGKSRIARKENPGAYIKLHNKWWLGYKEEEVVIYDDLDRSEATWIGAFLKTWGDHYPFPAETKGDGMVIRPKRIIITSNYSIEELFGHDEDLSKAIQRRYKARHLVPHIAAPVVAIPFPNTQSYDSSTELW